MRLPRTAVAAALAAGLALPVLTGAGGPATAAPPAPTQPVEQTCAPAVTPRTASCFALRRTDVTARKGLLAAAATPAGYGPGQLQSAYAVPTGAAGAGQTVAIVDAFDDPNAEADLATYRAQYGLPPCTTANGCFRKVDQRGGTSYPEPDHGWSTEISLDLDMVSAICPACSILLVESDDNSFDALGAAVDEAVALGAKYVSNSYGSGVEDASETDYDHYYQHPGVVITASTGDTGYGPAFPAASTGVTAVGGTSLTADSSARGWTEAAWSGAGSGCSQYIAKPAWQSDPGCDHRALADVSAVADPATGVAVYDTYQSGGWSVFGGTSASAPIIASAYALAGPPVAGTNPAAYPYDNLLAGAGGLNDVTGGSNGTCDPAYLCHGGPGYDGPTGLGTPAGVAAFAYRAHGTVAGTVTDTAGQPVPTARITVSGRTSAVDAAGRYTLDLPTGDYQITASGYGYQPRTVAVTVTAGTTTTADIALAQVPRVTVGGTVSDGSGHGWGLYAKVAASDGTTTWTDPVTGRYRLSLPVNATYTLHVTAADPGYAPADTQVTVAGADVTADVALTVTPACTAAGYQAAYSGTTESFSGRSAPRGWSVVDTDPHLSGYQYQPGWQFTNPGGRANRTGGSGNFAIVDSDHTGAMHVQDTSLVSPTLNLSGAATPVVQFADDLAPAVNSTATVDVSLDGGRTWATAWRSAGFPGEPGPATRIVALPQAAHQAKVRVRFHYTGSWSRWWAIDDVFVGNRTCAPVAGGLVVGQVTDAASGAGLVGATVTGGGATATTVSTPDDPALGDGWYRLFTAAGTPALTATAAGYAPRTATATVTADQVTRLDLPLGR
ncbi:MAG: carboxypeptidase regulatory-like domain-containing protein [Mycobacteriales bacterium]